MSHREPVATRRGPAIPCNLCIGPHAAPRPVDSKHGARCNGTMAGFERAFIKGARSAWPSLGLVAALAGARVDAGVVLFVDDDAPGGGDGRSWRSAYRFLQDALSHAADAAGAVTEIRVAQGTYNPGLPGPESCCAAHPAPGCDDAGCEAIVCGLDPTCCDIAWTEACAGWATRFCYDPSPCMPSFVLVSGVAVRGGFAGLGAPDPDEHDAEAYPTVLTGDVLRNDVPGDYRSRLDNTHHVVRAADTEAASLEDLTITAGFAWGSGAGLFNDGGELHMAGCRIEANWAIGGGGGGLYSDRGCVTLTGCRVEGNQSSNEGAGIFNFEGDLTLFGCELASNDLDGPDGGGAINSTLGTLTVVGCDFANNDGSVSGGAISFHPELFVVGSTFVGNSADKGGGAITGEIMTAIDCHFESNEAFNGSGGAIVGGGLVADCRFLNNSADGFHFGNAVAAGSAQPLAMVGCLLVGNSASAPEAVSGPATIVNCTFFGNITAAGGNPGPTLLNCILWGDDLSGAPMVMFSDVRGGFPGPGNFDADPLFVDPAGGDFRLRPGSPCIDAGHNWGVPPDLLDLDGDGDMGELTPLDLDSNPRFVAGAKDPSGCGTPAVVDMGAYEFQNGKPATIVLGDLDGNGTVGIADLLVLLAAWGVADEACQLADLNLDGVVRNDDLMVLLGNWR